jgi:hypothetical protein
MGYIERDGVGFGMNVKTVRTRLEPLSSQSIYPFKRASQMEVCALYWLPVEAVPPSWREKQWLMAFFDHLHELLLQQELRQESFLQMKLAAPLGEVKDTLHQHQLKLMPLMGLGRRPGAAMPRIPTEEDLEPIIKGKQKFIFNEHVPDYYLWLLTREERWRRDLFLGHGGYTMIYLKADPACTPPPLPNYPGIRSMEIFQKFDVDAIWETMFMLNDQLGEKSKAVFGKGLEEDAGLKTQNFVMPIMNARAFLDAKHEEIEEWFTVFDVYIQESPEDRGLLIASKEDIDEVLAEVLLQMREKQMIHPYYPDPKYAPAEKEEE